MFHNTQSRIKSPLKKYCEGQNMSSLTLAQPSKFSFFIATYIYFSNSYGITRTAGVSSRGKQHILLLEIK